MSNFWLALLAGFIGAAFTFLTSRFGIFLNRIRKRNVLNYNAVVKVEHLANEWGGIVNDNRQNLDTIIGAMDKSHVLPLNRLGEVPIYEDVKLKLLDLDLINRIFDIEISLRRFNNDAKIINCHLDSFQSGIVVKTLTPEEYAILLKSMMVEAKYLRSFYKKFLDELAELAAHARLRVKIDKTASIRLLGWIASIRKRTVTTGEINKEKRKVLGEIEENRKKSIERRIKIEEESSYSETNI